MTGSMTSGSVIVQTGSGPNTGEAWAQDARGNRYSVGPVDSPDLPRGIVEPSTKNLFASTVRKRP